MQWYKFFKNCTNSTILISFVENIYNYDSKSPIPFLFLFSYLFNYYCVYIPCVTKWNDKLLIKGEFCWCTLVCILVSCFISFCNISVQKKKSTTTNCFYCSVNDNHRFFLNRIFTQKWRGIWHWNYTLNSTVYFFNCC